MAGIDFGEGLRKVFLFGVGAVTTGAEKSSQLVGDMVKKGEATLKQNKGLGEEMTDKGSKVVEDAMDSMLRTWLAGMSAEDRAAYAQKVSDISSEIDAEAAKAAAEAAEAEAAEAEEAEELEVDQEAEVEDQQETTEE